MSANTQTRCCIKCKEQFDFYPAFYKERNMVEPKRCPSCAAKKRGRKKVSTKKCVLELGCVLLDIPDEIIAEHVYLKREDGGKERISCLRIKLGFGESCLTVYDHRNANPRHYQPLSGVLAKSSLRIMEADNDYQYVVLDTAKEGKPEAILGVYSGSVTTATWKYTLWAAGTWWVLTVRGMEGSLGEALCHLLQSR